MRKGCILTLVVWLCVAVSGGVGLADEPGDRECGKDVDLSRIVQDRTFMAEHQLLALNYLICRSLVEKDIKQCDLLTNDNLKKACIRGVKEYGQYIDLGRNKPSDLITCPDNIPRDECRRKAAAMYRKDESICDNKADCLATMRMDPSLAANTVTKDFIILMKAVRNNSVETCLTISNPGAIVYCQAVVARKLSLCDMSEGANDLKESYCAYATGQ